MKKDLIGKKFNRLTVVGIDHTNRHDTFWLCSCECGDTKLVSTYRLTHGLAKSCGCICRGNVFKRRKHGLTKSSEFQIWALMRQRCYNPNATCYHRYGGRGIKICARWNESFLNFLEDMGPRPAGASLDRINNDGDYEPANCRWASNDIQANNNSRNRRVTFNGVTLTITQWSGKVGIRPCTISFRLRSGWSVERALTQVVKKPATHET